MATDWLHGGGDEHATEQGRRRRRRADGLESDEIEHFFTPRGCKPKVAVGVAEDTLRDVLIRLEVIRDEPDGLHIFVGECVRR